MVTRIRKHAKPRLYIQEHIDDKGLSFEIVGDRLGVSRTTVWRWAAEQHRLDPEKIAALADAIGLDSWQDLARTPHRPSVDGILADADENTFEAVIDLARKLTKKAS